MDKLFLIVDIYQNVDSLFHGFITVYTEEQVDQSKELPTGRIYCRKTILTSEQVDKINFYLKASGILKLPTDTLISGWGKGFDGVTYCLEYKADNLHTFKSFWNPQGQKEIFEGRLVNKFSENVKLVTNIDAIEKEFLSKIPFESYNTGGPSTAILILTKEQLRKYKKDRDLYRKQHAGKL